MKKLTYTLNRFRNAEEKRKNTCDFLNNNIIIRLKNKTGQLHINSSINIHLNIDTVKNKQKS